MLKSFFATWGFGGGGNIGLGLLAYTVSTLLGGGNGVEHMYQNGVYG